MGCPQGSVFCCLHQNVILSTSYYTLDSTPSAPNSVRDSGTLPLLGAISGSNDLEGKHLTFAPELILLLVTPSVLVALSLGLETEGQPGSTE